METMLACCVCLPSFQSTAAATGSASYRGWGSATAGCNWDVSNVGNGKWGHIGWVPSQASGSSLDHFVGHGAQLWHGMPYLCFIRQYICKVNYNVIVNSYYNPFPRNVTALMLFTFQFLSLYLYPQPLADLYYRHHGLLSTLLYVV
jgi:hypothetical protein